MKKTLFTLLMATLCCVATVSAQKNVPNNYQKKYTKHLLPWIESQYIDQTQISNIDWMEYQYWLEHVFGVDSKEFKASVPDMKVLRQQLPKQIAEVYANSPYYKNDPVLGISREQAIAYCEWRTDRVAEQMLVDMKFIQYSPNQTRNDYFTLDNYKAVEGLQFLRFSLPTDQHETRYGFRCTAVWR